MKKLLFVMLLCVLVHSSFAQFLKKGSLIGGGNFEFQTSKYQNSDSKGYSFSLMPWAGYTVINNLVVGVDLEMGYSGLQSSAANYKASSNSLLIGPIVRYYLKQGVFFHGQNNFGTSNVTTDFDGSESTQKINSSYSRFGIGYAARISDTVLFEPLMGYYHQFNDDPIGDSGGFFIMGGFTIILKSAP